MRGKWIVKALIQKAISVLPNPQRANYFFQNHVTRSTLLTPGMLDQRVAWAAMHLEAFDNQGGTRRDMVVVEIGSGWYPIVPLCMYLAGARTVYMVDLEDLGRPELATQAITGMVDAFGQGRLAALGTIDPSRVEALASIGPITGDGGHVDALRGLGIRVSPGDARTMTFADQPDLVCSNTVFEHIAPPVLAGILANLGELSHPGMVMSHLIDHGDHYAYIDESIGIYNFLRYSDRAWRIIDNAVQPMNRLRAPDYVDMYQKLGIPITVEEREGCDPDALVGVPLAPRFAEMDPADVACASSHLVTRF